jgi:hypothetical protein
MLSPLCCFLRPRACVVNYNDVSSCTLSFSELTGFARPAASAMNTHFANAFTGEASTERKHVRFTSFWVNHFITFVEVLDLILGPVCLTMQKKKHNIFLFFLQSAYTNVTFVIDSWILPNTMYAEGSVDPCGETPPATASAIQVCDKVMYVLDLLSTQLAMWQLFWLPASYSTIISRPCMQDWMLISTPDQISVFPSLSDADVVDASFHLVRQPCIPCFHSHYLHCSCRHSSVQQEHSLSHRRVLTM